jgi:hypothetical protein
MPYATYSSVDQTRVFLETTGDSAIAPTGLHNATIAARSLPASHFTLEGNSQPVAPARRLTGQIHFHDHHRRRRAVSGCAAGR